MNINAVAEIYPIFSTTVQETDTRFGSKKYWREQVVDLTGRNPWLTMVNVEPIGSKKLLDLVLIAPCTGNTMAKIANGVADTAVLMAVKAQLRNQKPILFLFPLTTGWG